jgi:hypothetical protein
LGYLTRRHREADATEQQGQIAQARDQQIQTLDRALAKVRGWLATGQERRGVSGSVVHNAAFGQGQEHNLLAPVLEGVRESFRALGRDEDILAGIRVTADAGLHSEANLRYLQENRIDGYGADTNFRPSA